MQYRFIFAESFIEQLSRKYESNRQCHNIVFCIQIKITLGKRYKRSCHITGGTRNARNFKNNTMNVHKIANARYKNKQKQNFCFLPEFFIKRVP